MEALHPFFSRAGNRLVDERLLFLSKENAKACPAKKCFFAEESIGTGSAAAEGERPAVDLPLIKLAPNACAHGFGFSGGKTGFFAVRRVDHMTAANDHLLKGGEDIAAHCSNLTK